MCVCLTKDCLDVMRKSENQATVIIMATKHHTIRNFLFLKSKRLISITFVKVDAHQDDVKSFDELFFLEQLNVQCDTKAKALMSNVLKDDIIPFPLDFS